jgi:hypothetical protein
MVASIAGKSQYYGGSQYFDLNDAGDRVQVMRIGEVVEGVLQQSDLSIGSMDEFCNAVQQHSQQTEGDAVEAVFVSGSDTSAIGGFQFSIASDLEEERKHISGSYLTKALKKLDEEEHCGSLSVNCVPPAIAQHFGFADEVVKDKPIKRKQVEADSVDSSSDTDSDADTTNGLPIASSEGEVETQADEMFDLADIFSLGTETEQDETDDLDDELSDLELFEQPIAEQPESTETQTDSESSLEEPDTRGKSPRRPKRSALDDVASRATTAGSDLNGLNLMGGAAQGAVLVTGAVLAIADQLRLAKAEEELAETLNRAKDLSGRIKTAAQLNCVAGLAEATGDRLDDLMGRADAIAQFEIIMPEVEAVGERADALAERADKLVDAPIEPDNALLDGEGSDQSVDALVDAPIEFNDSLLDEEDGDTGASDTNIPVVEPPVQQINQSAMGLSEMPISESDRVVLDSSEDSYKRISRVEGYLEQINDKVDRVGEMLGLQSHHLAGVNEVNQDGRPNPDFAAQKEAVDSSPTLRLDPSDSVSQRLDKIEKYLEMLNKKLDVIEGRVEEMEAKTGIRESTAPFPKAQALPTLEGQEQIIVDGSLNQKTAASMSSAECGERLLSFVAAQNKAQGKDESQAAECDLTDNLYVQMKSANASTMVMVFDDSEGDEPVYKAEFTSQNCSVDVDRLSDRHKEKIKDLTQGNIGKDRSASLHVSRFEKVHPDAFTINNGGGFIKSTDSRSDKTIEQASGNSYDLSVANLDNLLGDAVDKSKSSQGKTGAVQAEKGRNSRSKSKSKGIEMD